MINKVNNLRTELSQVITLVEDMYSLDFTKGTNEYRYIETAYDKLKLALSWLTDMAIEMNEDSIDSIILGNAVSIVRTWKSMETEDRLTLVISWIDGIIKKVIDLHNVQEMLNEEMLKNYEQAKLSTEDTDITTREILREIYSQLDDEMIDYDEQINAAKKLVKEAKFFLTFILENY